MLIALPPLRPPLRLARSRRRHFLRFFFLPFSFFLSFFLCTEAPVEGMSLLPLFVKPTIDVYVHSRRGGLPLLCMYVVIWLHAYMRMRVCCCIPITLPLVGELSIFLRPSILRATFD